MASGQRAETEWPAEEATSVAPSAVLGASSMPAVPTGGVPAARAWLAYIILLVVFAFMGLYAIRPGATYEAAVGVSAAATASRVEEGRRTRQGAVLLLAGLAALTLSAVRRKRNVLALEAAWTTTDPYGMPTVRLPRVSPPVARVLRVTTPIDDRSTLTSPVLLRLLVIYLALAAVSAMWADDVFLAVKRAVVLFVLAFAAYALAQAWSLRELVYFSIVANAASLALGIGGALARGDFHPSASDYRFSGFANPNLHGMEAACLAIAAGVALWLNRRHRVALIGIIAFGLVMLLLTKSRTALAALVIATGVAGSLIVERKRIPILLLGAAALVFAMVVFLPSTVAHAHNAALLGRSAVRDDPATLSGRTLLWKDLLYFVGARPWLGYGFDSFWTPDHIAEISVRRGWVIAQAHSGYFESLLSVGLVGATLLILVLISALVAAIRRYRRSRTRLALFPVAMLVWYMINMLAEAVPEAHFNTLIVMIILAHLALRSASPDDSDTAHEPEPAAAIKETS